MIHYNRQQVDDNVKFNFKKFSIALLLLIVTLVDAEEAGQPSTTSVGIKETRAAQRTDIPLAAAAAVTQWQQIIDHHGSNEEEKANIEENQETSEEDNALLAKINDSTGHNGKYWEVSKKCLDCLCYFATDCDLQRQCETPYSTKGLEPGMEKGDCGPFHISLPFWADGNNLNLKLGDAVMENQWKKCSLDLDCATELIQKYFHKYPVDCNKDGKVDCVDYAAIHTLGPFGCQKQEILAHWNRRRRAEMLECMAKSEEGRYTKKMKQFEEKKKLQDIAGRKNEYLKENESKGPVGVNTIPQEVEDKTPAEVNGGI